jgi:branched-chain amino acid transport system substrate-binding protein
VFPAEPSSYTPQADQVASKDPDLVVLGSTDVPTVQAFMKAFETNRYTPKMFLAVSGPDQGQAFTSAVGAANTTGIMVPNAWYPGYQNTASEKMVSEYVSQYGGTASGVNADVAEAYSVGQVAEQAMIATGGTDNSKIIQYLHSGVTLNSVQGAVKFDSLGENASAAAFVFQWQDSGSKFVQVLPAADKASVPIVGKAPWATG